MQHIRKIRMMMQSRPTLEGAGVHLRRAFGFSEVPLFDPFLLLDDFRNDDRAKYMRGFPWHPHRGIETITYVLCGDVEHGDSMGNMGIISSGDVQWMTAGSGIVHQEMPKGDRDGRMWGFQLWANLPAHQKMMRPRYRDVKETDIQKIETAEGVTIRVICGKVGDVAGPVKDIVIDPQYLDITVPANTTYFHSTQPGHTVFAYIFEGRGIFTDAPEDKHRDQTQSAKTVSAATSLLGNCSLVLFEPGEKVAVRTQHDPVRFLLIAGKPISEPIAWQGPIVMNSQDELRIAFEEYRNGTFIKHGV